MEKNEKKERFDNYQVPTFFLALDRRIKTLLVTSRFAANGRAVNKRIASLNRRTLKMINLSGRKLIKNNKDLFLNAIAARRMLCENENKSTCPVSITDSAPDESIVKRKRRIAAATAEMERRSAEMMHAYETLDKLLLLKEEYTEYIFSMYNEYSSIVEQYSSRILRKNPKAIFETTLTIEDVEAIISDIFSLKEEEGSDVQKES